MAHRQEMTGIGVIFYALAFSSIPKDQITAAKARYYAAVEGQTSALREARDLFDKLRSSFPSDPLILAYSGSIQLLESARTMALWRKGKLAKEGLRLLDEAVARSPQDPEIRFIRAASTFHLPGFFRREEQSKADFAWLAPQVPEAVARGRLERRLGAAALYHHGLVLDRSGNGPAARDAWRETIRIGQDTRAAADARKRLEAVVD
jgi:hypothetical protein